MMKKEKSHTLLYGLILGGIIGAGVIIYFGSKFINTTQKNKRERKHKFFEGLDDIFESSAQNIPVKDSQSDDNSDNAIVEEIFNRSK